MQLRLDLWPPLASMATRAVFLRKTKLTSSLPVRPPRALLRIVNADNQRVANGCAYCVQVQRTKK